MSDSPRGNDGHGRLFCPLRFVSLPTISAKTFVIAHFGQTSAQSIRMNFYACRLHGNSKLLSVQHIIHTCGITAFAAEMPSKSPFTIDIPLTDVLSYAFPHNSTPSDKPIWIDAQDTKKSLSPKQLLGWVKRLGVGLDRLGIQQNEVVMMYSSNHIFVPAAYLGIAGSGRVFSGCNPAYGVNGTEKVLLHVISANDLQRRSFKLKTLAHGSSLSNPPSSI